MTLIFLKVSLLPSHYTLMNARPIFHLLMLDINLETNVTKIVFHTDKCTNRDYFYNLEDIFF